MGHGAPAREHADPARRYRETEGVAVDLRLDGKVAVVTGASKGIGRCVAEFLAREGCDVVITARTAAPLEAAAEKIAADTGRAVLPLAGDMSVTEDIQRCVDATLAQFGHIDILVTCAGSSPGGLLEDLTEEQWQAGSGWDFANFYDAGHKAAAGQIQDLYNPTAAIEGKPAEAELPYWGSPPVGVPAGAARLDAALPGDGGFQDPEYSRSPAWPVAAVPVSQPLCRGERFLP